MRRKAAKVRRIKAEVRLLAASSDTSEADNLSRSRPLGQHHGLEYKSRDTSPPLDPHGELGVFTHALLGVLTTKHDLLTKTSGNSDESQSEFTWGDLLNDVHAAVLELKPQMTVLSGSMPRPGDAKATFKNSRTGGDKKKALYIGVQDLKSEENALTGARGDVKGMRAYMRTLGFHNDRVLLDDGDHKEPNIANIQEGIMWLADGAEAGDSLLLYFAGHGDTVADTDMSEEEQEYCDKDKPCVRARRDQAIWGCDATISDDWIFDNLVAELDAGVLLTGVIDSCHAGSVFDLPYSIKRGDGYSGGGARQRGDARTSGNRSSWRQNLLLLLLHSVIGWLSTLDAAADFLASDLRACIAFLLYLAAFYYVSRRA